VKRTWRVRLRPNACGKVQKVNKAVICLVGVVGVLSGIASAQELKLGLGVSYRELDDVEFNGLAVRNFRNLAFLVRDGEILNYTPENLNEIIENLPGQTGAINTIEDVDVSSGRVGGEGEFDSSEGWAPVLTAEYVFMTRENITLGAVANIQYFGVETSATMNLGLDSEGALSQYFVVGGDVAPIASGEGTEFDDIDVAGTVDNEFEMDLYVLDLGLKLAYCTNWSIDVFLAAGGSINIADANSEVSEFAVYSAGSAGGEFYRQSQEDGSTEVLLGVYGALGAQWWFSETIGVVLEGRYDEVFNEVETDYAEVDLDGFSGLGKILIRF
jgi:hypothetical protein